MEFHLTPSELFKVGLPRAAVKSDSPLLGSAIDDIVASHPSFDFVYISHTSLSWQAKRALLEEHETRILSQGPLDTEPLLTKLHLLVMELHRDYRSLLFHPSLFHVDGSARSHFLLSHLQNDSDNAFRQPSNEIGEKLSDIGEVNIEKCYFKPKSLQVYQRFDIKRYQQAAWNRITEDSSDVNKDANVCMRNAHEMCRAVIADLAGLDKSYATFYVACPILFDVLGVHASPQHPLGMFWLFLRKSTLCDGDTKEHSDLLSIIRSVWLLLSAYYVRRIQAVEFARGTEHLQEAFGHQVKKLPLGISGKFPYWLWDQEKLKSLEGNMPSDVLKSLKIAPLPELLDDLGRLLTFWSFECDPSTLFLDEMPDSLLQIVRHAADFASKCERARHFSSQTIENLQDLEDARDFPTLKVSQSKPSQEVDINHEVFYDNGELKLNKVNKPHWVVLAGLIRLLVVVCEGAIQYKKDGAESEIRVKIVKKVPATVYVRIENDCMRQEERNARLDSRMGMKGKEIMDFICSSLLTTIDASIETEDLDETFTHAIQFTKPDWMMFR